MSISQISVVIIAKNAENTIEETLHSLQDFNEVILYLNDSIDKTRDIAERYSNVKIVEGEFIGFGKTKNAAIKHSKHNWILSLDSDEILDKNIIEEIDSLDLKSTLTIFSLKRDNYFLGEKTQSVDIIERLFNKKHTLFNDNNVHEKVLIQKNSKIVTLDNHFKHLNITHINQTLTKIIKYTDLGAENKKICFFPIVLLKAMFAFFKTYILEKEILSGWIGVVLAINAANRRYYKYLKQYLNCKKIL